MLIHLGGFPFCNKRLDSQKSTHRQVVMRVLELPANYVEAAAATWWEWVKRRKTPFGVQFGHRGSACFPEGMLEKLSLMLSDNIDI